MSASLFAEQLLNGVQTGILLFLLAAGLTLVFGIMDLVNLAHGSFYMLGAFVFVTLARWLDSFTLGLLLAVPVTALIGVVTELVALRTLYEREHLDQVLATFGLVLFFDQLVLLAWPAAGMSLPVPGALSGALDLGFGVSFPRYRMLILIAGLVVAALLYLLIARTRLGMLIRAGASNRAMAAALGVNIRLLFTLVFGLGAALAGFAGMMMAPILSATSGMGGQILILTFVVIVIGGIGSIKGAFIGAMLTGVVDTLGRAFLGNVLGAFFSTETARAAGPTLSSMLIYILMALVLFFRPEGLFPAARR